MNIGAKHFFAHNLAYLMDINHKSRNDICNDLNLKYTTFRDWQKGNTFPRIEKLELLAKYFKVTVSQLVDNHIDTNKHINTLDIVEISNDLNEVYKNQLLPFLINMESKENLSHQEQETYLTLVETCTRNVKKLNTFLKNLSDDNDING